MARITNKALLDNGWKASFPHKFFSKGDWIIDYWGSGEWTLINTKNQDFEEAVSSMEELEYKIENYKNNQ